ncbi:hypothetical protein C9374_001304 [Naegleria lovaniensis]|uniref:Transmembrane protein n=1 Tax=Naegleria lovaniensis TaxID=51637 RepID=A0AA88GRU0_NAELO|nr:uncharacterized protein C9374_001304 [Naegleria lovaniensis]KAG2387710.1 hypothetical protein C9374_001304 [Naegleria lovaniensis]
MNQFRVTFSDDEEEVNNHSQSHHFVHEEDDDEELFLGRETNKRGFYAEDLEEEVQADPLFQAKKHELEQKRKYRRLSTAFIASVIVVATLLVILGFSIYFNVSLYFGEKPQSECLFVFNETFPIDPKTFRETRHNNLLRFLEVFEPTHSEDDYVIHIPNTERYRSEMYFLSGISQSSNLLSNSHLFLSLTKNSSILCMNYGNTNSFTLSEGSYVDFIIFGYQSCLQGIKGQNFTKILSVSADFSDFFPKIENVTWSQNNDIIITISTLIDEMTQQDKMMYHYISRLLENLFTSTTTTLSQMAIPFSEEANKFNEEYFKRLDSCVSINTRIGWPQFKVLESSVQVNGVEMKTLSMESSYSYLNKKYSTADTISLNYNNTLFDKLVNIIDSNIEQIEKYKIDEGRKAIVLQSLIERNTMQNLLKMEIVQKTNASQSHSDFISKLQEENLPRLFISEIMIQNVEGLPVNKISLNNGLIFDLSLRFPFGEELKKVNTDYSNLLTIHTEQVLKSVGSKLLKKVMFIVGNDGIYSIKKL